MSCNERGLRCPGGLVAIALLLSSCLGPPTSEHPGHPEPPDNRSEAQETSPSEPSWTLVSEKSGLAISERQLSEQDLPQVRAVGDLNAPILDVLATLSDVKHHVDWVYNCAETRIIKDRGDDNVYVYSRVRPPLLVRPFVQDRDTVFRAEIVKLANDKGYDALFVSWPGILNEVRGVVRLPRLSGAYRLRPIDATRTRAEYIVEVDPGGSLPAWLKTMVVHEFPYHTLAALRAEVEQVGDRYSAFKDKWARSGFKPEDVQ